MNPSLENPFRPTAKRATKRLFKAGDKQKTQPTKNTNEKINKKMEQTIIKYGPFKLFISQVEFLEQIEELIPQKILNKAKKSAKEILIEGIIKVEAGNIIELHLLKLDLSELPSIPKSLQILKCYKNELTKLPELPESLQHLDCDKNQLTKLPLLPKTLQELSCSKNQLTELPPLPNSLQNLSCDDNQLTRLPPLPESLQGILCDENKITNLPPLPETLQALSCEKNQLTELPPLPDSLQVLSCRDNPLTEKTKEKIIAYKNINFIF